MNRETIKLLNKLISRIARENRPSQYCYIVGEQHYRDTTKREIPMRVRYSEIPKK